MSRRHRYLPFSRRSKPGFAVIFGGPSLFVLLAWSCLLLVQACRSPASPPRDYQGPWSPRALLERSVEAYGGAEAVLDFQDLSQEQEIVVQPDRSRVKGETLLRFVPPDRLLFVLRLQGGDEKVVFFDGRESGERINGKPTSRNVETEILRWRRLIRIHAFFLEQDVLGVKLAGPVELGEMRCALLTKTAPGESWKIWIDLERFFIRMVRLELPLGDRSSGIKEPLTVDRRYHDFQRREGRLVPMALLPRDVQLISGHNGRVSGFDFIGKWEQLPLYADMMKNTVAIVRQNLAEGKSTEEMQSAGVLDDYKQYAGSYVGTNDWIKYIVDALTVPKETRKDICLPIFEVWKKEGARAAVDHYRQLEKTREQEFDFNEITLLSIGSKLYSRGLYKDASEFFLGSIDQYPKSNYLYYTHYLAAKAFHSLDQTEKAFKHCKESVKINPDFQSASKFLEELSGKQEEK